MEWKRKWGRRPSMTPPAPPEPERLEEARQALEDAHRVLVDTLDLGPAVRERAEKARRIHQENNLGPSFWRAVEGRHA